MRARGASPGALLTLMATVALWRAEAAPAQAGDIVLDSTQIEIRPFVDPAIGYLEVRAPNGTVRGRVAISQRDEFHPYSTAVTRRLAFALSDDALHVASIDSSTYKVVARIKIPAARGALARLCFGFYPISVASTADPDVTEVYLSRGCYGPCPDGGGRGDHVSVYQYSSTTKQLTALAKTYPLYFEDQCKNPPRGYVPRASSAIIGGVPYAIGNVANGQLDTSEPEQVFKLTTRGPVASGINRPSRLQCMPDFIMPHVAGVASYYALCKTGKIIGVHRKLQQKALFQFRKGAAPRLVGRLPLRTTIHAPTDYWLATAPNVNPKMGKTLYVVGATLIKDVRFVQNLDGTRLDNTVRLDMFSLDKTKIASPFRRRWRLPRRLHKGVALHVVP